MRIQSCKGEIKLGGVIAERRDEVVLASKIDSRDREGALAEVERSLNNLQTDHLDILFMHAVKSSEELAEILQPGGALEAFRELKEAGRDRSPENIYAGRVL